VLRLNRMWS